MRDIEDFETKKLDREKSPKSLSSFPLAGG